MEPSKESIFFKKCQLDQIFQLNGKVLNKYEVRIDYVTKTIWENGVLSRSLYPQRADEGKCTTYLYESFNHLTSGGKLHNVNMLLPHSWGKESVDQDKILVEISVGNNFNTSEPKIIKKYYLQREQASNSYPVNPYMHEDSPDGPGTFWPESSNIDLVIAANGPNIEAQMVKASKIYSY